MKKNLQAQVAAVAVVMGVAGSVWGQVQYAWRYYRPGNTGIQGDFNGAIFIGADGDPWIGGYNPSFEEGGFAKFVQGENRWVNVSNVDYPVIGHPDDVGTTRVSDIVEGEGGVLWLGTWRGLLRSTRRWARRRWSSTARGTPPCARRADSRCDAGPTARSWVSAESTSWGGGGLTRHNPATGEWTHFAGRGGGKIAARPGRAGGTTSGPRPASRPRCSGGTARRACGRASRRPRGARAELISLDSVDEAGNVWMTRWVGEQGEQTLDCLRPDGSWVSPALPPLHPQVNFAAIRAYGVMQLLMVDGFGDLQRFERGRSSTDLGPVPHNGFIDDLDVDAAGNVWLCGSGQGGALRRDAESGAWQRYRVTNTSQFDFFNADLSIDRASGDVYACTTRGAGRAGWSARRRPLDGVQRARVRPGWPVALPHRPRQRGPLRPGGGRGRWRSTH